MRRDHAHGLAVLHAQRDQQWRALEAGVRPKARHIHHRGGRKIGQRLHRLDLEAADDADPWRALRAVLSGAVFRARHAHEIVLQAAASHRRAQRDLVPHLLHRDHVGVEHLEACAQPRDLALELVLAVGVLAVVEGPSGLRQVEQVAGGHHKRGKT
ncbi:hypothetical protein FQZ97_945600 [compost metagenome]